MSHKRVDGAVALAREAGVASEYLDVQGNVRVNRRTEREDEQREDVERTPSPSTQRNSSMFRRLAFMWTATSVQSDGEEAFWHGTHG